MYSWEGGGGVFYVVVVVFSNWLCNRDAKCNIWLRWLWVTRYMFTGPQ